MCSCGERAQERTNRYLGWLQGAICIRGGRSGAPDVAGNMLGAPGHCHLGMPAGKAVSRVGRSPLADPEQTASAHQLSHPAPLLRPASHHTVPALRLSTSPVTSISLARADPSTMGLAFVQTHLFSF